MKLVEGKVELVQLIPTINQDPDLCPESKDMKHQQGKKAMERTKVAEFILLMEGEHPALKAINEQRKLVTKLQHLRLLPVPDWNDRRGNRGKRLF
jgi:hypothetical protein